jgi:hypothetical protein
MADDDEPISKDAQQLDGAGGAAGKVSGDDAGLAARRHPLAHALAHRLRTTTMTIVVIVSIAAVLLGGALLAIGISSSQGHRNAVPDGTVVGYLRAIGGPGPACAADPHHCHLGYFGLSGTVRLVPASGKGMTYYAGAVDGQWRITVPPGTYFPSGQSGQVYGGSLWAPAAGPVIVQSDQTDRNVYIVFQIR